MERRDYAFPFRIDPGSGQAARTRYDEHVAQMIRQVLLTAPGERADLPEFGCGVRQLLFAPRSPALDATTQLLVQRALGHWLAGQIEVKSVQVVPPDGALDEGALVIQIGYVLLETQSNGDLTVVVT